MLRRGPWRTWHTVAVEAPPPSEATSSTLYRYLHLHSSLCACGLRTRRAWKQMWTRPSLPSTLGAGLLCMSEHVQTHVLLDRDILMGMWDWGHQIALMADVAEGC